MTQNIKALDFNGVGVALDSTTKLVHLFAPAAAATETLHNREDNSNYQVPTGKKFTVIYITSSTGMTNESTDLLIYADDADGTTNAVTLLGGPTAFGDAKIFISAEVPAAKYINKNAGVSGDTLVIEGIEEDA